ncbi:MAG: hypothetical protein QXE01_11685 [Sulfolobales archaeon]
MTFGNSIGRVRDDGRSFKDIIHDFAHRTVEAANKKLSQPGSWLTLMDIATAIFVPLTLRNVIPPTTTLPRLGWSLGWS